MSCRWAPAKQSDVQRGEGEQFLGDDELMQQLQQQAVLLPQPPAGPPPPAQQPSQPAYPPPATPLPKARAPWRQQPHEDDKELLAARDAFMVSIRVQQSVVQKMNEELTAREAKRRRLAEEEEQQQQQLHFHQHQLHDGQMQQFEVQDLLKMGQDFDQQWGWVGGM